MLKDEAITTAIGRVSANFQYLELAIMMFVGALISDDVRIAQILVSQLSFSRLCTVLDGLFRLRTQDTALIQKLETLLSEASSVEQKRNTLLHSVYLLPPEGHPHGTTRAKLTLHRGKGLSVQMDPATEEGLNQAADEIYGIWETIFLFMQDVQTKGIINLSAI